MTAPQTGSRTVRIAQQGLRRATDFPPGPGREPDLGRLVEALRRFPALVLTGPHGVGKSTLASMVLGHFTTNPEAFRLIAWCGLRGDEGFAEFAARLMGLVGGKEPTAAEFGKLHEPAQVAAFMDVLRTRGVFLVIDGLELRVDRRTRVPRDLGFAHFLGALREDLGETRVVITARDGYAAEGGLAPERFVLGGLSPAAGAELLRQAGLEDAEPVRREASERAGGLPRGLQLLARLCLHGGGRSVRGYVVDPKFWGATPEESAVKLAEQVVLRTVDGDDRKVLLAAGMLDGAIDATTLAAATDLAPADVTARARQLVKAGLLNDTNHGWCMDALVRASVAPKVRAARAAYRRVEQSAASRVPKVIGSGWDVEDLRPALTVVEAALRVGELERALDGLIRRGLIEALVQRGFVARAFTLCDAILETMDGTGPTGSVTSPGHGGASVAAGSAAAAASSAAGSGTGSSGAGAGAAPGGLAAAGVSSALVVPSAAPPAGAPLRPELQLALLRMMVDLCGRLGRERDGVTIGVRGLTLAEELGETRTAGEIYLSLGHMYLAADEFAYALDAFERAAECGRDEKDARLASAAWIGSGRALQQKGELGPAARAFAEAATAAANGGDKVGRGVALLYGASARETMGDIGEALRIAREALGILTVAKSPHARRALALVRSLEGRGGA